MFRFFISTYFFFLGWANAEQSYQNDVLNALINGEDPTYACNARLKNRNPDRFRELQIAAGTLLPTKPTEIDPLSLANKNAKEANEINKFNSGLESDIFGIKQGCDGKGNCELPDNSPDNSIEDPANPIETNPEDI